MTVVLIGWLGGCVAPLDLQAQLEQTQQTIAEAHRFYGPMCAPVPLARAQANLDFAQLEMYQANVRRASEHLGEADHWAKEALATSVPCGGSDGDGDTVVDVVDRCPDEREDLDGEDDDDGCIDANPMGDLDSDGVINMDDACVDVAEDKDNIYDEDGCPETEDDSDGDGVIDAVDGCENEAEDRDRFQDQDGCPEPDNDGDKIMDFVDKCANEKEDVDSWLDEDGCPDPDNDGDGIADRGGDLCPNSAGDAEHDGCPAEDFDHDGIADEVDRCKLEPEAKNGYLDEDGCPDELVVGIKVTSSQIKFEGSIQFESGSAVILRESYSILDNVVKVLQDAQYLKVRIEGHTDGESSDDYNLSLSRDRANAVMKYLTDHGVAEHRLQAIGYGETRPIDTNRTADGRARNRRVEFHLIE